MMKKKNNLCNCGCGDYCEKNYIRGHARRNRKNSIEHNEKISKANKGRICDEKTKERLMSYNINKKHTEETKKKISKIAKEKKFGKWMLGKKLSEETKRKISENNIGHVCSEETKRKISLSNSGEKNGMYGKTHTDKYREYLKNNIIDLHKNAHTKEAIEKRRKKQIGRKHSDDTKKKMRISHINHILKKNNGIRPMHNVRACEYLDGLSKKNGWNLQHALNGGEFYIKELGFFIDGYDLNKNIVVEYDEKHHYDHNGNLKEKDVARQQEIINHLNCSFYRYNEKKQILYEIH